MHEMVAVSLYLLMYPAISCGFFDVQPPYMLKPDFGHPFS